MHLCAGLTATSWILEPIGEIGANFSYNFHLEYSLLKLVIKKLWPKINVKNIKKSSLILYKHRYFLFSSAEFTAYACLTYFMLLHTQRNNIMLIRLLTGLINK